MGIFFPKKLQSISELSIKEPGQKERNLSDENEEPTDYNASDGDYSPDNPADENQDNTNNSDNPADNTSNNPDTTDTGTDNSNTPDDTTNQTGDTGTNDPNTPDDTSGDEPTDYSLSDNDLNSDDSGTDSTTDTTGDTTTTDTGDLGGDAQESPTQAAEKDLFKDLTPEQLNIKIMELKDRYLDLYNSIDLIEERTNKIPKTSDNTKLLEFIIDKLTELKKAIYFYTTNTFDTKSYIENSINYQEYLATIDTINKLFTEISNKKK